MVLSHFSDLVFHEFYQKSTANLSTACLSIGQPPASQSATYAPPPPGSSTSWCFIQGKVNQTDNRLPPPFHRKSIAGWEVIVQKNVRMPT